MGAAHAGQARAMYEAYPLRTPRPHRHHSDRSRRYPTQPASRPYLSAAQAADGGQPDVRSTTALAAGCRTRFGESLRSCRAACLRRLQLANSFKVIWNVEVISWRYQ